MIGFGDARRKIRKQPLDVQYVCFPIANVNFISQNDFSNPCEYPIIGYDCDGNCLYDCDADGVCDWNPNHCYDMSGNPVLTDEINNLTLEEIIGLKLELAAKSAGGYLYGIPIFSAI